EDEMVRPKTTIFTISRSTAGAAGFDDSRVPGVAARFLPWHLAACGAKLHDNPMNGKREPVSTAPPPQRTPAPSDVARVCPNCGAEMLESRCKLKCPNCDFFLSCSDFY